MPGSLSLCCVQLMCGLVLKSFGKYIAFPQLHQHRMSVNLQPLHLGLHGKPGAAAAASANLDSFVLLKVGWQSCNSDPHLRLLHFDSASSWQKKRPASIVFPAMHCRPGTHAMTLYVLTHADARSGKSKLVASPHSFSDAIVDQVPHKKPCMSSIISQRTLDRRIECTSSAHFQGGILKAVEN
jgi:hypothetical protein